MGKTNGLVARILQLTICVVLLVLSASDASSQVGAGTSSEPVTASDLRPWTQGQQNTYLAMCLMDHCLTTNCRTTMGRRIYRLIAGSIRP
jgi:hypothetical protein